jgi:hypothetical protein
VAILLAAVLGIATPSRNITCFPLRGTLHCQIAETSYRRAVQAYCTKTAHLDWVGFEVGPAERGVPTCSGGALTEYPPTFSTLAYGRTWRSGSISCISRVTGLTCTAGTHGLFISRASWRGW